MLELLSMMTPLAPPVTPKVAEVVLPVPQPLALVTLNDIMQPLPLGQLIGLTVKLPAVALTKIESVEPFRNSVTDEQFEMPVVDRAGPTFAVVAITLLVMGTCHNVGSSVAGASAQT